MKKILLSCFIIIITILLVSAISLGGQHEITTQGNAILIQQWDVESKTGEESQLTFWTSNKSNKKTSFGFLPPNNDCTGWSEKKATYNNGTDILDDKNKPITLKCESSKCDGQNCYYISLTDAKAVNIDKYFKLGDNSFIVSYQKTIVYTFDWGQTNITLNSPEEYDVILFWDELDDKYIYGADIPNLTEEANMSYTITSDYRLSDMEDCNYYSYYPEDTWNEKRHLYSTEGLNNRSCELNGNTATINFTSNGTIRTKSITQTEDCRTFNVEFERYELTQDINSTGTCFIMANDSMIIDMMGFSITDTSPAQNENGFGLGNRNNNTIMNGTIINFGDGMNGNTNNGSFLNLNITASTSFGFFQSLIGLDINGGNNNLYENITIDLQDSGTVSVMGTEIDNSNFATWRNIKTSAISLGLAGDGFDLLGNHHIIFDSEFSGSSTDLFFRGNRNLTLINTTFTTEGIAGGMNWSRGWWYQARVNDTSGVNLSGESVLAYNNTGDLFKTFTTDSNGLTEKDYLIEFTATGSIKTYYNNYTINVTNSSFTPSTLEHSFNLTIEHNIFDVFTFDNNCFPPALGNWNIIQDCNHTVDKTISGNITVSNNANQTFYNGSFFFSEPFRITFVENTTFDFNLDVFGGFLRI